MYWDEDEDMEERTGLELALLTTTATGPFFEAAEAEKREIVLHLVRLGADPNTTDSAGCTPLILACEQGGTRAVEEVEELLEANADPRMKDALGRTPLELALRWNQQNIAERLIAAGSDVGEALDRLRLRGDVCWLAEGFHARELSLPSTKVRYASQAATQWE
uniref:Ankyrin repeat domain-containing protein n=1 Tax=Hanusia phi TaxID=3032 RepID=A0A7S0ECI7_9CRYP